MWKVLNILVKMSVCLCVLSGSCNTYAAAMIAENTEPGAVIYILPPMPIKEVMDYPTTPGSIPLYKPSARKQMPQPGSVQHVQQVPYLGSVQHVQQVPQPGSIQHVQQVPYPGSVQHVQQVPYPESIQHVQQVPQPGSVQHVQQVPYPGSVQHVQQVPYPGSIQHVQQVPYPGVYTPDQEMKPTPTQKVKRRRQFPRKQTIEQSRFDVSNQEVHQPGPNIPEQEEQPRSYSPGQNTQQPEVPGEDMATAEHNLVFRPLFVYRQQQERRRRRKRPNRYYSTGSYTRIYRPRYVKPICYRIP